MKKTSISLAVASLAFCWTILSCHVNEETLVVDPLEDDIIVPENILEEHPELGRSEEDTVVEAASGAIEEELESEELEVHSPEPSSDSGVIYKDNMICIDRDSDLAQNWLASTNLASPKIEVEEPSPEFGSIPNHIPTKMNKRVGMWIKYFTGKSKSRFQRYWLRGSKYRALIEQVLAEEKLPKELFFLALVESGFSTKARSHAGAVGMWQFMRGTGLEYGLKINSFTDERQDPIRATRAAAKHLASLYRVFQDWELAMAAYNTGQGRVLGAIMRAKSRDFWTLHKNRLIPRETRDYVPKFYAAMLLGTFPEKYNMALKEQNPIGDYAKVSVPGRVSLKQIAKTAKVSLSKLKLWNPHLRKGITPNSRKTYNIWVPHEDKQNIYAIRNKLRSQRMSMASIAKEKGGLLYRVRRGDNLQVISKKHNTSVAKLKEWNGLRSSRIYAGQKLIVASGTNRDAIAHKVRRGQNLNLIAQRYGVSVSQIKRLNHLKSSRIYIGQRLKISAGASPKTYKVRRGDNLSNIARKHRTSVSKIKRKNRLASNNIKVGQILKL